ncbi:serine hydrolase domain-containing protein [Actinosynnema sp. NPDC053489]|uniref:serine hydrolase domain-containing protein n=1 Tax=Actinosynnema sp. NPDC053489 TaxID=3363916 RepID=UPI0037C75438
MTTAREVAGASRGPGVVVAVRRPDGLTVLCRGHTDRGGRTRVTGRTRFEIGSVTKTFTALLLATLAAEGAVDLDAPVARHLAALLPAGPHARDVTARHLATHTAGLPRLPPGLLRHAVPRWYSNPYRTYTADLLAARLPRTRLRHPPGHRTRYSNLGIGLLGHLLTRAAGLPYPVLLRDRVLDPLGLTDTGDSPEGQATGHWNGLPRPPWLIPALPAAGALRSSAHDLVRYLDHLANPPTAVPPPLATALRTVLHPGPGEAPLVWAHRTVRGRDVYFHGGATRGSTAFTGFLPHNRTAVAALTNSGASTAGRFIQAAYLLLREHVD